MSRRDSPDNADGQGGMDMDTSPGAACKRRRILPEDAVNSSSNQENIPVVGPQQHQRPPMFQSVKQQQQPSVMHEFDSSLIAQLLEQHEQFCQRLNLDVETKQASWNLFSEFIKRNSMNDICDQIALKRFFGCSVWTASQIQVYKAKQENSSVLGLGISFSQVLQLTGAMILDFFHSLKKFSVDGGLFIDNPGYRGYLEKSIAVAQHDYSSLSMAYMRYKDLFNTVFRFNSIVANDPKREDKLYGNDIFNFIWLLFLYSKEQLVPEQNLTPNNVMLVLVSSVYFVMNQVSTEFLCTPAEVANKWRVTEEMMQKIGITEEIFNKPFTCLLHLITAKFSISPQEYFGCQNAFLGYINKEFVATKQWNYVSTHENLETKYPTLVGSFELANRQSVLKNTEVIAQKYHLILHTQSARYDGRLLAAKKSATATPRKILATPKDINFKSPAARNLRAQFARASSFDNAMISTPLTARDMPARQNNSMFQVNDETAGERLKVILASYPEGPSKVLQEYFDQCDPNLTPHVMDRVRKMLHSLVKMDPSNDFYFRLAMKFYFKLLEQMLKGEEMRLGRKMDFEKLLKDSDFHRCIICCALDLTRTCFKLKCPSFENILCSLRIQPFDLCPVIELCIKYDGRLLNWNMIKRLKEIEERILESEVWKEEKPLYHHLAAESSAASKDTEASMNFLSSPRKALNFVTSKPNFFRGESVDNSSALHPNAVENSAPTKPLELFFRKLYRLVHFRLHYLCSELGIDEKVIQKIWNVLVEGILRENELRLLYRRHIDQIILCAIYAVCRFLDIEITFREIVAQYRKQPQANPEMVKKVLLENNEMVDIIVFHNKVFVPTMKLFIHGKDAKVTKEGFNHPMPQVMMSPRKLPGANGSYCQSPGLMTPRTMKLYNPGEGSAMKSCSGGPGERQMKSARKLTFAPGPPPSAAIHATGGTPTRQQQ